MVIGAAVGAAVRAAVGAAVGAVGFSASVAPSERRELGLVGTQKGATHRGSIPALALRASTDTFLMELRIAKLGPTCESEKVTSGNSRELARRNVREKHVTPTSWRLSSQMLASSEDNRSVAGDRTDGSAIQVSHARHVVELRGVRASEVDGRHATYPLRVYARQAAGPHVPPFRRCLRRVACGADTPSCSSP